MAVSAQEPPLRQKVMAAAGAACVSVLVVNPLDVVKTRLQAAGAPDAAHLAHAERPLQAALHSARDGVVVSESAQRSAWGVARHMVRHEGWASLWRGTGASLALAAPTVGIYYPLYDALYAALTAAGVQGVAPAMAGGMARSCVVLTLAPLELVRTRIQAARPGEAAEVQGVASGLAAALREGPASAGPLGRARMLWRGTAATLARDVPFSALYWAGLEPMRRGLTSRDAVAAADPWAVARVNMLAGAAAGALAAMATTPFDVVKTRMQVAHNQLGALRGGATAQGRGGTTLASLRAAALQGGLFVGAAPRAMRAAPACSIVLASYELLKLEHFL